MPFPCNIVSGRQILQQLDYLARGNEHQIIATAHLVARPTHRSPERHRHGLRSQRPVRTWKSAAACIARPSRPRLALTANHALLADAIFPRRPFRARFRETGRDRPVYSFKDRPLSGTNASRNMIDEMACSEPAIGVGDENDIVQCLPFHQIDDVSDMRFGGDLLAKEMHAPAQPGEGRRIHVLSQFL